MGHVWVTEGGSVCVCVLHKLSSHSACIPWLTVLKAKWNVGQTPPPFSSCVFYFSPLSQTTRYGVFILVFLFVCLERETERKGGVGGKPSVLFG